MADAQAQNQDSDIQPARKGQGVAVTVDTTARAYDLTVLPWNTIVYLPSRQVDLFLDLRNEGTNPIYYYFAPNSTVTLNEATVVAAGGTLALDATVPNLIPAGQMISVRCSRTEDPFIHVKSTGGTSTLRIFPSSQSTSASGVSP